MTKFFTLIFFFCVGLLADVEAQSNTLSSGGQFNGSGGSSSFSIGTIDYTSTSGTGGIASQGLQHAFEIFDITALKGNSKAFSVTLFPNPSGDFVSIQVAEPEANFQYSITSIQGIEIGKGKITESQTLISLYGLSKGNYFVKIFKQKTEVKTYHLIKN